ncbi:MAG: peptidoglycan DD-metalloendopeptidase family protein [Pseudomonadales bacterium]|nr:peptidoglycan DD-metalloendopeptidase family protein [Pseudomonadales bacterium]MCP5187109.1 peptidoglycan DD-metalloendopeptidase family protein [Pseudomonadales bacterium]
MAAVYRALAVALLGLVVAGPVGGQSEQASEQETRARLERLQRDIKEINAEISRDNQRKSKLQEQLRQAEVALGALQRDIAANQRAIAASEAELDGLQAQRVDLEQARNAQQARIALELKTAWQMGQQGQVKVLLNQEDPHTVARAMAYYQYFFRARNDLVGRYRETLEELRELEERIAGTLDQQAAQQAELEQQQAQLETAQAARKETVASLSTSIESKAEKLKQLEQDRKELEKLLEAIARAVADLEVPEHYQPFKAARGKMPWPLAAKRVNNFGRPRNEGKMRWQGVTIPAREGSKVNAIHHGRVVYADWLRGSGLLLIIDHGDGYMSLYAHNQSLLREVGEWVKAGTPVSTVGNSGGQEQAALYFEIRHQGKPVNPASWCRD